MRSPLFQPDPGLSDRAWLDGRSQDRGRFVALVGDAELDEGNIYEALIEGAKHDVRNLWWILDYNRQSLDATSADRMFERFDEIFRSCGWRVVELRYGKRLKAGAGSGIPSSKAGSTVSETPSFRRSHYQGGAALAARIEAELGKKAAAFLKANDDAALASLFSDLGGHCMESLVEAFDAAQDDVPTLFIAWTIKGNGLPFAGHKDNHAGLMNPTQMAAWREAWAFAEGREWEPLESVGDNARPGVEALIERSRIAREKRNARSGRSIFRPSRHRPARSNRRRPLSAESCSRSPSPADARRPHRYDLAGRDRFDQPRRMGEPARPLPARGDGRHFCAAKDCVGAKMVAQPTKASTSNWASPRTICS